MSDLLPSPNNAVLQDNVNRQFYFDASDDIEDDVNGELYFDALDKIAFDFGIPAGYFFLTSSISMTKLMMMLFIFIRIVP